MSLYHERSPNSHGTQAHLWSGAQIAMARRPICEARYKARCYELRCEGKVIGGFGAELWRIRAEGVGTPAAGLLPTAGQEGRVFLLNSLNRENYLTLK
jgi:hypothetical protein